MIITNQAAVIAPVPLPASQCMGVAPLNAPVQRGLTRQWNGLRWLDLDTKGKLVRVPAD